MLNTSGSSISGGIHNLSNPGYDIINKFGQTEIILIVEHPKLLLELEKVVSHFSIEGLAFGLHDFA